MDNKEVTKKEDKKFEVLIPKKWAKRGILLIIILLLGGGSVFAYKEYKEYKMEKMAIKQSVQVEAENDKSKQRIDETVPNNNSDNQRDNGTPSNMSIEEVKQIVIGKYGNEVVFTKVELDYTDDYGLNEDNSKKSVYEIDFKVGNTKYEADINAVTGEIFKAKVD